MRALRRVEHANSIRINFLIADSDTQFLYSQFLHKAGQEYTPVRTICERRRGFLTGFHVIHFALRLWIYCGTFLPTSR